MFIENYPFRYISGYDNPEISGIKIILKIILIRLENNLVCVFKEKPAKDQFINIEQDNQNLFDLLYKPFNYVINSLKSAIVSQ